MTVMGDAAMNRLSDRGSIPLSSIEKNLERSRFFSLCFHFFYSADIRIDHHRIVGMIDDKSRLCAVHFFYMFLFHIVDLHLFRRAVFGIVGGKARRFLEGRNLKVSSSF